MKLLKFSLPHPTEKFRSDYIKIVSDSREVFVQAALQQLSW